jgi:alpha-tubulin suppressor-like RCC1 family protein
VWGSRDFGGELSSAAKKSLSGGVKKIVATGSAFAALKGNGAVIAWGGEGSGGDPGKTIQSRIAGGVKSVHATESAFAAITRTGGVIAWGDPSAGGKVPDHLTGGLSNVSTIYASNGTFAAVAKDRIISWGSRYAEGVVKLPEGAKVVDVVASSEAFAALTDQGQVLTWGKDDFGGRPNAVASNLLKSGVLALQANYGAIAAIKSDGRLISWGDSDFGGKKGFDPFIRDVVSFG